ncbi:MAG: indolepyruvate oxidoreductase subunit beta [Actinomycetales bacterium]|nr:indolepyruvate oxidoreductase subunit beta [Actinomycetales bacterium]
MVESPRPAKVDMVLVGVGGQGTILASNILADLGMRIGYDVKKAEVHGMSQRGGSVISHVRWGAEVHSPIIATGAADLLLAVEQMEAGRYAGLLRPGGTALVNEFTIEPITVITGGAHYPSRDEIESAYAVPARRLLWVPGAAVATELGNKHVANIVLLGALSRLLPDIGEQDWIDAIQRQVKPSHREFNRRAFEIGRSDAHVPGPGV